MTTMRNVNKEIKKYFSKSHWCRRCHGLFCRRMIRQIYPTPPSTSAVFLCLLLLSPPCFFFFFFDSIRELLHWFLPFLKKQKKHTNCWPGVIAVRIGIVWHCVRIIGRWPPYSALASALRLVGCFVFWCLLFSGFRSFWYCFGLAKPKAICVSHPSSLHRSWFWIFDRDYWKNNFCHLVLRSVNYVPRMRSGREIQWNYQANNNKKGINLRFTRQQQKKQSITTLQN